MKTKEKSHDAGTTLSWDYAFGFLICLFAFLFPFFPDEKLIRLKLEVFEASIFILILFLGIKIILTNQIPSLKNDRGLFWVALSWTVINFGLGFLSENKSLAFPELRRVSLAFACYLAFRFGPLNNVWKKRFLLSWVASATVLAFYGVLQYTGGLGPIDVPKVARVNGTFGNPIFFASFLLISFFLTMETYSLYQKNPWKNVLLVSFVLIGSALVLTKTRAAWLGLSSSLLFGLVVLIKRKMISPWILAFLAMGVLLFGFKTKTIWKRDQGHLMIWRDTARMWLDHPITGVGLGAFHTQFQDYAKEDLKSKWPQKKFIVNYAHNEYVQMLAEGGLLVFVGFMSILFLFFRAIFLEWKETSHGNTGPPSGRASPPFLWGIMGVMALLVQNGFSVDMRFSISFGILFLIMGLSLNQFSLSTPFRLFPASFESTPARIFLSGVWLVFMGGFLFPRLIEPYKAREAFQNKIDFFDKRLIDPDKAIENLEKLAQKNPTDSQILEELAFVYSKEIKRKDKQINRIMAEKAINTYLNLLKLDPKNASANNNLANIYYTLGRVDEALDQWEKAVLARPDFIDVHLNLGKIYYTQGKLKKAADHFEKVLNLDSKTPKLLFT